MKTKTKNIEQQNKTQGYGLLSMMAMIIGIVIGSGIFVKNAGLIAVSGNITSVVWAWVIGSLLVIAMVIAFIEIISITEISGEQSTLTNWGRKLIGIRFGKFIGYYVTLAYFPIIIAALFVFASGQLVTTMSISGWINTEEWPATSQTFLTIMIATAFLAIVAGTNALTTKPGKYFQNIGTCIKTIPLFFVILLFLYIVVSNFGEINFSQDKIIDALNPADSTVAIPPIQSEMYSEIKSQPLLIMMTLPAILFAFDGFLLAGALSKEAKKPSTFKMSFIISMIFIVIIYILFSVATLGLGDPLTSDTGNILHIDADTGNVTGGSYIPYGSIDNVIYTVWKDNILVAQILAPVVSFMVLVSILTGVSGCLIACARMLSDMSATNTIENKNMDLIEKNKYGVSSHAGFRIMGIVAFWMYVATIFDSVIANKTGRQMEMTMFMADLVVIGAFFIYGTLILGGIINRFRAEENQVKVNKNKIFLPAAILAVVAVYAITAYFAFTIITPFGAIMGVDNWNLSSENIKFAEAAADNWFVYWMKLSFTTIFIVYVTTTTIYNIIKTEKMSDDIKNAKAVQTLVYYGETIVTAKTPSVNLQKEEEMFFKKKKEVKKTSKKEQESTNTWGPVQVSELTKAQKETKANNRGLFMELKKDALKKGSTLTKVDIEKVLKEREAKVQYKTVGEICNREGISNVKL